MEKIEDQILKSQHENYPFGVDVYYEKEKRPLVVFVHGFKGFKDWGHFHLMGEQLVGEQGFQFCKFNLSHNGTSPDHPTEFVDLEAFGRNTFSIELDDLGQVLDYLLEGKHEAQPFIDPDRVFLVGHSRGGGLVVCKAAEDKRIRAVATLAAVHRFDYAWNEEQLEKWRQSGVYHIRNHRTNQQMPLYYTLAQDLQENRERVSVERAAARMHQPLLIMHGDADPAVPVSSAQLLADQNPKARVEIFTGTDHVFGGKHPWESEELPKATGRALDMASQFFQAC